MAAGRFGIDRENRNVFGEKMNDTLKYYEDNAEKLIGSTAGVDFSRIQNSFLQLLPPHPEILDFGCGSGRDTKYFLQKGCHVTSTDGSEKICQAASSCTGIKVKQMLFQELEETNVFDGIWACASILHVSKTELYLVLRKMCDALKSGGIIYTSFKYGEFEGNRNGRYVTDFTEISFQEYIRDISEFSIEEIWITGDVRPGRGDEKWLNLILRKMDIHCQSMENT
ncbi:class I SAM-dependent methyltransferase [Mediterraneibacter gnavus]|uniref:class I SAM-dependent methyltransferase n=1 Tax=Mediterraneibacter gnavus TaxID=33038 RepID=UPI0035A1614C